MFVKRHAENPGINHPFAVVFDSAGDLYVFSQNTSLISRYHGPASRKGEPGTPMPLPESLHLENTDFPPGTFVPSAKLASHGLLEVRAVIFAPNNELFVADPGADCVRIYEARTANHLRNLTWRGDQLARPIHLLLTPDGRYLLIGSGGTDQFCDMIFGRAPRASLSPKSAGLNGPAGMAFGEDGFLYVASGNSKQILRYSGIDGRPGRKPFINDLADNPEFLMLVGR